MCLGSIEILSVAQSCHSPRNLHALLKPTVRSFTSTAPDLHFLLICRRSDFTTMTNFMDIVHHPNMYFKQRFGD
jgi:hypothetical protein